MEVKPRENILESVKAQIKREGLKDKKIMLCFTCDPYPAFVDTTVTREIIKAINESGNHVQILTKGGERALRDFDLLNNNDSFGVTVSCFQKIFEPNAAPWNERLASLAVAHAKGIKTWISCEPVFNALDIYEIIKSCDYIDFYKIGKLNYMRSEISWGEFGRECEALCKQHGREYYIKEDLRKEMEHSP
jgi:DNA repair photolyase